MGLNNIVFPFVVTESSKHILRTYPDSNQLKDVFTKAKESERYGIIRLWLTEGIPFAFRENPLLYEEIRTFIASGIKVHPKEVTLVGSARIGYSLKPKVWGRIFTEKSDMDFTVISNELFTRLVKNFQKWAGDLESKRISPRSPDQLQSWIESIMTVNMNISKGYIYTKNLFPHNNYPTVVQSYHTMGKLKKILSVTPGSPEISDVSIRVYSSWYNCIRQIQINLKSSLSLW